MKALRTALFALLLGIAPFGAALAQETSVRTNFVCDDEQIVMETVAAFMNGTVEALPWNAEHCVAAQQVGIPFFVFVPHRLLADGTDMDGDKFAAYMGAVSGPAGVTEPTWYTIVWSDKPLPLVPTSL